MKIGVDWGEFVLISFQTRGTNVPKIVFSGFLYVKRLLFICFDEVFFNEFLNFRKMLNVIMFPFSFSTEKGKKLGKFQNLSSEQLDLRSFFL